jgi:hypothetical protein
MLPSPLPVADKTVVMVLFLVPTAVVFLAVVILVESRLFPLFLPTFPSTIVLTSNLPAV